MILLAAASGTSTTRVTETGPITATHLIIIAIFAIVVILGILWGAKQKRARAAGEREEVRAEALTAHPPTAAAPPPPQLGDAGVTASAQPLVSAPPVVAPPKPKATAKPKAAAPVLTPVAKTAPKPKAAAPAKPAVAAPAAKAKAAPAKAPAAAKPVPKPAPRPAAPATPYGLIDVKGLGPKAVPLLEAQGVADLPTLAGLTPARAAEIDGQLGVLSGRMARDRWVEQAKLLAAGNIAEFESTYGKL